MPRRANWKEIKLCIFGAILLLAHSPKAAAFGESCPSDEPQLVPSIRGESDQQYRHTLQRLGMQYEMGIGTHVDLNCALKLYEMAGRDRKKVFEGHDDLEDLVVNDPGDELAKAGAIRVRRKIVDRNVGAPQKAEVPETELSLEALFRGLSKSEAVRRQTKLKLCVSLDGFVDPTQTAIAESSGKKHADRIVLLRALSGDFDAFVRPDAASTLVGANCLILRISPMSPSNPK